MDALGVGKVAFGEDKARKRPVEVDADPHVGLFTLKNNSYIKNDFSCFIFKLSDLGLHKGSGFLESYFTGLRSL